jgi:hypothetical protein
MAFNLQQQNYPLGEKYDLQTITKHMQICENIRDKLVYENKLGEPFLIAEYRFNILFDVRRKQRQISTANDRLCEYTKTMELLESDASNNIITEMEYLTKSKELVILFKIVSYQIEKNKIILEEHLQKYMDTFKTEVKKIRGTAKKIYHRKLSIRDPDSD